MKFEEAWFYLTTIDRVFVYRNGDKGGVRYPKRRVERK